MKEFIFEIENSLSTEECEKIIHIFEEQKDQHYEGIVGTYTSVMVDKNTKITVDMAMEQCEEFSIINKILLLRVQEGLNKYLLHIDPSFNIYFFDKIFPDVNYNSLIIHKYFKNKGVFQYHNDFNIDQQNSYCNKFKYRIFNYLFYLNDVDEGGETEFFGNAVRIKPKCGKLLFFPSEWFYPHKGCVPISNDKYVIAGWIYVNLD
jgi:hypothetical protein